MNRSQMAKTLLLRGEESLNMFFSTWQCRYDLPNLSPVFYTSLLSVVQGYDIALMSLVKHIEDKKRLYLFRERLKRAEAIDRTLYSHQYYACNPPTMQSLELL